MNAIVECAVDVLVEPRTALRRIIAGKRQRVALAVTVVYMLTTIVSIIVLLNDETLVLKYIDHLIQARPASMSIERLESARDRTTAALGKPGIAVLVGVHTGISRILRLGMFWGMLGLGGVLGNRTWRMFPDIIWVAMASTSVLTLGTVVNLLLRMLFRDLNAVAGLLPLVGHCGSASMDCVVTVTVDLFVLWYLAAVSMGCALVLGWTPRKASVVVIVIWILYLACSFLIGTGASWTM